ncbi:MAG: YbdD/YjiX family protein [Candidatus Competibacteraceae bacterium]|nr:YbdD/YjiX family protein [Candidatus Competibacteraceae bacterium]
MRPPTEDFIGPNFLGPDAAAAAVRAWPQRLAFIRQAFRRIIGAPDYEVYLARHRQIHPEASPLSEKEFFRFAIERRYSKAGPRCC